MELHGFVVPEVSAVVHAYETDPRKSNTAFKRNDGGELDPGVVFAGLGDPLLRLDDLLEATAGIRDEVHPGIKVRDRILETIPD